MIGLMKAFIRAFPGCIGAMLLAAALSGCLETRVVEDNSLSAKLERSGASAWMQKERTSRADQPRPQGPFSLGLEHATWTTSPNFKTDPKE